MSQFKGQSALVTGAGRGIGKAIALRLAREGADVAVTDINGEAAQATAKEIEALGRRSFATPCDVSNYDQAQSMVAAAIKASVARRTEEVKGTGETTRPTSSASR